MRKVLYILSLAILVGCGSSGPRFPASPSPVVGTMPAEMPTTSPAMEAHPSATPSVGRTAEATPATGQAELDHQALLDPLLYGGISAEEAQATLGQIASSADTRFVAALIDALRYQSRLRRPLGDALNALTGQELPPDWFEWVEWAGQHPEIESFAGYPGLESCALFPH